ncbi:MAG TPA: HEAT repeat domain-containing protein [Saprospiraceae bacterium]|nr:HEAT repeat domain-containing protein [Saprospiraceae bacterium]HPG06088.1 HEAT repeat domain-containing protein [Saprospiraceae bacterium]HRV84071.1 HEAT repeat domain-containing protein [Saprospiraceae bacterium]
MKTWDENWMWDYLRDEVTAAERDAFEEALTHDATLRARLKAMQSLDESLTRIGQPVPSKQVSQRFYAWLEEQEVEKQPIKAAKRVHIGWKQLIAVAASIALVAVFAQQWLTMRRLDSIQNQLANNQQQVWMNKLKSDPSTSQRLVALNETAQLPLDREVLNALFDVAAKDPSPNVRLAGVDVLSQHLDDAQVKGFFLGLLKRETDPSVLIEIINAFGIRKDKSVIPDLENLMAREEVQKQIKGEAQMSINKINSIE